MALDPGGGSQPRVVVITHHTYGPSYTRRVRRGNTIYIHRYIHISPPAAPGEGRLGGGASGGGGGGGGGSSGGGGGGSGQRARSRQAYVISRQRLLRALGYSIRVDGIWGPQSQRAWSQYQGRGGTANSTSAAMRERQEFLDLNKRAALAKAKIARQQRAAVRKANVRMASVSAVERVRGQFHQEQRALRQRSGRDYPMADGTRRSVDRLIGRNQRIVNRELAQNLSDQDKRWTAEHLRSIYSNLQVDIRRARDLTLKDIVLLSTHGMNVTEGRGAEIVQRYLRANGHDIKIDRVFGPETARAFEVEFRRAVREERAAQIRMVVNSFYRTGVLERGAAAPAWWPFGGKTPSPDELRRILQEGGFSASIIWYHLQRELRNPYTQYVMWRSDEIRKTADSLFGPLGPTGVLGGAMEKIIGREPDHILMARVYGQQVADAYANPLYTDEQEGLVLARLAARWRALNESHTIQQFQRNLKMIEFEEERAYVNRLQLEARNAPWWADVLGEIMRPGEWMRTQLIAEMKWLADDPVGYLKASFKGELSGLNALQGDVSEDLAYYQMLANEEIEDSPWLIKIAYELLVDPVNIIPIGGIASKTARLSMRGVSLTGRTIQRGADYLAPLGSDAYFKAVGKGIERAGLESLWLPQGARLAKSGLLAVPGVGKMVTKSTALKLETQRRLRETANLATRHRFRPVQGKYPGLHYADDVTPKNTRTLKALDEAEAGMIRQLHIGLGRWVAAANKDAVSIFGTHARSGYSTPGAMIRAASYELARIQETKRLAHAFGTQKRDAFKSSLEDEKVFKQWSANRPYKGGSMDDEIERVAGINYKVEYMRIIRALGVYGRGTGEAELEDLLYTRVFDIAKKFEDHVLVHLQTMLETMADDAGESLFDDAGKWIGTGGELESKLQALVKESFDEANLVEVPNPMYAKVMTQTQAENRIQSEIRRREASYFDWVERRRAAGHTVSDETVENHLKDIEDEIRGNWHKLEEATWRFKLNEDGLERLRNELNLPPVPIELEVLTKADVKGIQVLTTGQYLHDTRIILRVPGFMLKDSGAKAAVFYRRALAGFAGHEYRHAFQWDVLGPKEFYKQGDEAIPYPDRPIEIDATAFQSFAEKYFTDVIDVERVPAGSYVNTAKFKKVSPLQARDLQASWFDYKPHGDLTALASPSTSPDPMMQELADVIWALGPSPKQADEFVPSDWQIGTGKAAPGLVPGQPRPGGPARFDMAKFREWVFRDEVAVGKAYDEVMAKLAVQNWAFMQALAYKESTAGRATYTAIKGSLDVWITLALPLRSGWVIRNTVDNFVKIFIAGARDPRAFFLGAKTPGAGLGGAIHSVFELGVRDVIYAARTMDNFFGTDVATMVEDLADSFWLQSSEVIGKIFRTHAIPVSDEILEQMSFRPWEMPTRAGVDTRRLSRRINKMIDQGDEADWAKLADEPEFQTGYRKPKGWIKSFRDGAWDLMASRPENYFRRALYRDTFYKEQKRLIKSGVDPTEADVLAMKAAWEKVEATLFDYSKETVLEENLKIIAPFLQFWRKNTRFWVETMITKPWVPYDLARMEMEIQMSNDDLPDWAKRYLSLEPIADLIARVPKMEWLADYIKTLGFESFVTDPMNFLSAAPLWRAFKDQNPNLPQDGDGWAFIGPFIDAMNDWGLSLNPFVRKPLEGAGIASQRSWQTVFPQTALAAAFTEKYVSKDLGYFIRNLEHVFTLFQGEPPADAVAEDFAEYVQQEMANQAVRGEPVSRAKAEEIVRGYIWLQTLLGYTTGVYARKLTQEDIYLYKLHEDVALGRREYANLTSEEKKLYEIWRRRKINPAEFDRYIDAVPYIQAFYNQPDFAARQRYKQKHPEIIPYIDPAWRGAQWSSNYAMNAALQMDTESAIRMWNLAKGLELDAETIQMANNIFVTEELREYWAKNDTGKEARDKAVRGLIFRQMWSLNTQYFSIPDQDYDAKRGFLDQYPQLQDFWNEFNDPADDYAAVLNAAFADLRQRYFEIVDTGDWDSARVFLEQFPFIFDSVKGDKYVRDRSTGRPKGGWKDFGDFEDFSRFGSGGGLTEHARDYLAARQYLDTYFALPQGQRSAWLNSGSPAAEIVLNYFKKYGSANRVMRQWKNLPMLKAQNAELAMRLKFWTKYFSLDPDKRGAFVMNHGEKYGIFIYGVLSAGVLQAQEAAYLRQAFASGMTAKAAHFLYVKPLLDFFFTLNHKERKLFLRLNPELQEYFDKYTSTSPTGDPKLDKLLDKYFSFPPDSPQRTAFLEKHPEVQDYFDEKATPAERAMRNLLEQYFDITDSYERKEFLLKHPEIQDYFDRKADERDMEQMTLSFFDEADPRFRPYLDAARFDLGYAGGIMRETLQAASLKERGISQRRERATSA